MTAKPCNTADADIAQAFALAVERHQAGRLDEAEHIYRMILEKRPDHAQCLNLLGVAAAQTGRFDMAVQLIGKAIAQVPEDATYRNNLGEAFRLQRRMERAATAFRWALVLDPAYAEALNNRGAAQHALGRLDEAAGLYHRALAVRGHYPEALNNLGAACQACNRLDEAMRRYRQAIALKPDYAEAHSNLGTVLLTRGEFVEGWREYEWRRHRNVPARSASADRFDRDLAGRTVLLQAEQGLGDTLQFARFATPLAAKGATVILESQPALARLLRSIEGVAQVVIVGEAQPRCDVALSSMSVPHLLGTTLDTIPARVPYVGADPQDLAKWGTRLAALPGLKGGGLKVGLAWAGAPRADDPRNHAIDRRRSMALARLAPLFALPDVRFVSLQKGDAAAQATDLPAGCRLDDWMDEVADFADTAALVANLDLVISVDTSVAHLAGALGKPVWILSRFDGCWRWLHDRDDSPWYPTARLFRQTTPGDWDAVVARVAAALKAIAPRPLAGEGGARTSGRVRATSVAEFPLTPPLSPDAGEREITASPYILAPRETVQALFERGVALQNGGRPLEAEAAYREALSLDPEHALALNNLANVLAGQGRREDAEALLRAAIEAKPDYAEAHYNLGVLVHRQGRLAEAEAAYRAALRVKPGFPEAMANLGSTLQEQDRLAEAEAVLRACLALWPNDSRGHLNLGVVFKQQSRLKAAIASYRRAIACQPDYPLAHVNLAQALLQDGVLAEGWREYEWRWSGGVDGLTPRHPPEALWQGQNLTGRTVLLHAEQGLGDTLHFVRYAKLFARQGASVVLEVQAPLVRLLSAQPYVARAAAMGEALPDVDYHLPLMSTPAAWRTTLDNIPAGGPYVAADPVLAARWGARLGRLAGLKVGLVWAGDPRPHDYRFTAADRRRSIPLAALEPLLSVAGVSFVSLQKGTGAAQLDTVPPELRPLDLMEEVSDFADTAAIAGNLDLVIAVDTSVAHLAGALGKPVWILSRFDGCWRWLMDRDDSPWYPTARLFRQRAPSDWDEVIARVVAALELFVSGAGVPARLRRQAETPDLPASPDGGRGRPPHSSMTSPPAQRFASAIAHHRAGRLADAEAEYRCILAYDPDHADSLHLLGVVFHQQGRLGQAIAAYERAVLLKPGYAEAQTNLGMARLANGEAAAGWQGYEWRWRGGLANLTPRDFDRPQWQGEPLDGRTILLHGEQGFGDVLQFIRYAPLVAARGGRVIVEAYAPLARLLESLPGDLRIAAAGAPLPAFDCHAPLMSLPHAMGEAAGTAPGIVPYLQAAPSDAALWRRRLAGRPAGHRVGLVWAGNPRSHDPGASAVDRRRSIALHRLKPLLAVPGIDFISLQTGDAALQLEDLPAECRPLNAAADLGDFADTAGLLAALDLLISVDTAAVHLAGALGKPVWMLSRFDGCWRWLRDRDDSPWYPTLRLFRQETPGEWETVVDRVAAALRDWVLRE